MPNRVSRSLWIFNLLFALAWLIAPAAAQSFSTSSATSQVSTAGMTLPDIHDLIEKGHSLEVSGRWAEALSHYESALREYPDDASLAGRFDLARLHYSLEQRYDDRSFRDSIRSLNSHDAVELYGDMLSKIGTHYYTTPPWQNLFRRGAQSLDIALADKKFLSTNGVQASASQIEQFRAGLRQLATNSRIASRTDAVNVAGQAAQLGRRQIGLAESATILEFTAAAASALDHYSAFLTADQLRDIYSQIEGNFVGLGVELKADNGALLIVHVIPNSPAAGRRNPRRRPDCRRRRPVDLENVDRRSRLAADRPRGEHLPRVGRLGRPIAARAVGSPGSRRGAEPRRDEDYRDRARRGLHPHPSVPKNDGP